MAPARKTRFRVTRTLSVASFNRGLGGGQSRDGDSARAAAHVVQPDFVAEVDGLRIAAVFATDADLQVRAS